MKRRAVLFVLICLLAILPVAAQKSKPPLSAIKARLSEIRRIDAYVKTLDALVKKTPAPHLIFADTSEYEDGKPPQWQRFADQKALEKFREETRETYTIAFNWRQRGRIVRSNFTLFSPSGDWTQYMFHNFRADGSLAHAQTEMRTFNGDLIVIWDFYHDRRGKLLKKTVKYRDLTSNKPIKPTKEFLTNNADWLDDAEYYKKTSLLPFANLLKN
jgi:hypothetical protein